MIGASNPNRRGCRLIFGIRVLCTSQILKLYEIGFSRVDLDRLAGFLYLARCGEFPNPPLFEIALATVLPANCGFGDQRVDVAQ